MDYGLSLAESSNFIVLPKSNYEDAMYWANRIVELGSKGVYVWKNGHFICVLSPKSKETE